MRKTRLKDRNTAIKPLVTEAQFKEELRGCVESSKFNPLGAKKIWKG